MPITPSGATVWRDYVTDGVPASGAHKVYKPQVRAWSESVEDIVTAAATAALVFDTRANLYATLTAAANTLAWVLDDSTAAYNGIYRKSGASGTGSWSRVGELPYSFIVASDVGAGTANAIQATTSLPVTESALVVLNIFETNTASPVTVSFNGGAALTVKTNTGNDVAVGGLLSGMLVLGRISGATFRIVNDQVSSAIVAQAEAAASAAEDARDAALAAAAGVSLPPVTANTMLVDNAAGTARESKTFAEVRALLEISAPVEVVASKAEMLALDTSETALGYLDAFGIEGLFKWTGSDVSAGLLYPSITSTAVNSSTGNITRAAHGLFTGMAVIVTTAVNGLSTNTIYYVNRVDADTIKLCSSPANAVAGTSVTLTGTTNFSFRRHRDPLGGVYITPTSEISGASGAWVRQFDGEEVHARWFGLDWRNNSGIDDADPLQAAIYFAEFATFGAQGRICRLPSGIGFVGRRIHQPNRVSIRGANGRGTVWKPHSSFASDYLLNASNGTSSMFGSSVEDIYFDARGKNMTGVIQSQAWQETSGLKRCCIQFDGTTGFGLVYQDGHGGAAFCPVEDCEIFSESTSATAAGILVNQVSSVGGFVLSVVRCTITGSAANILPNAIRMTNDSLHAELLHCEYVTSMATIGGVGGVHAEVWTGSANAVTNMITLASAHTGKISARMMIPNGATGNIINFVNPAGTDVAASGGMLANYSN